VSRSNKANLHWIDAVGAGLAERLSRRFGRPMIYHQSGPYTQSGIPHVGIYFNDPIFHYVASAKTSHTSDFRFGYYIERTRDPDTDEHIIMSGFDVVNPTLCGRFFLCPISRCIGPKSRRNSLPG
jgi:hypothetical protein